HDLDGLAEAVLRAHGDGVGRHRVRDLEVAHPYRHALGERPAAVRTTLLHHASRPAYATPARARGPAWRAPRARVRAPRRARARGQGRRPLAAAPPARVKAPRPALPRVRARPRRRAPAAAPRRAPAGSGTPHAPSARPRAAARARSGQYRRLG